MVPLRSLTRFFAAAVLLATAAFAQTPVVPDSTLTDDQRATRFLAQATFGPSPDSLDQLRQLNFNYDTWIDQQAALTPSSSLAILQAGVTAGATLDLNSSRRARNEVMLAGADQLRQRMAYALSQIMVVSDLDSTLANAPEGLCSYYDMLARNALGSFRTLMIDVTRHPVMGRYLSHYRNRKANTSTGTRPDENFAREVMQLFTIGLYNLQPNGDYIMSGGRPVESYTNDQITEFARVFTGLHDQGPNNTGTGTGRLDFPTTNPANFVDPMRMWEPQHDVAAKTLLTYTGARKPLLPAGQTGLQDINDAIDNLVEHPNTAPFISRILIQRLVTSNPSSAYVGRVAAKFVDNGYGVRGDLLAVAKAILLDAEARNASFIADPEHGKLRDPFLRLTHLLRTFRFTLSSTGPLPYDFSAGGNAVSQTNLGHFPMSSPSVFNFFSPDYEPPGLISDAALVAPEFQVHNSVFAITTPNAFYNLIQSNAGRFRLDIAEQTTLAATPSALLDNLNLYLTHGTMSTETRNAILTAVTSVTGSMVPSGSTLNQTRARLAIYLTVVSPDFAILK